MESEVREGLSSPRKGRGRSQPSVTALPASQASGLSEWMGKQMEPLRSVPPAAVTLILSLLVAVFTECTSNVATTTLFLPIFASMVSDLLGR